MYVTCPDDATARRIARDLVERRLAACANILPVRSVYRWEGKLQEDAEVAMFLKTKRALVPEVVRAVEAAHPYDTPCVVAFDLVGGAARYLGWVDEETL